MSPAARGPRGTSFAAVPGDNVRRAGRGPPQHLHRSPQFLSAGRSGVLHAIIAATFTGPGLYSTFAREFARGRPFPLEGNSQPRRGGDLLPCPLPVHPPSRGVPKSARRRARWHRQRLVFAAVDSVVVALNYLALGRPREVAVPQSRGPLNDAQQTFVDRISARMWELSRLADVEVSGGLSAISKALDILDVNLYSNLFGSAAGPLTVSASNTALPTAAGLVELDEHVLPSCVAQLLREPHHLERRPEDIPSGVPRSCWRVDDWPALLDRMMDIGMVVTIPDSEVPRLHGLRCEAGLFGVAKKASDLLRLIVDRRRSNARERPFRHALWSWLASQDQLSNEERAHILRLFTLPCGAQFTDAFLHADEEFDIFLEDAKDFYYVLRWPASLWASNAVGPAQGAVAHCIVTPGMGDCKAAEIAQGVSSGLLRRAGALPDEAWMTYRYSPPCGDLWAGAYIDDLAHVGFRPRSTAPSLDAAPSPARTAHDAGVQELERLGIPRSAQKAVLGASTATVWGAHLDSERRAVSIEPGKRWTLVLATSRILHLGFCSAGLLARLLGCWNFQLGFRRCGLCLLDLSYKWVQRLRWSWTVHRLPAGVGDELRLLVALCMYWETDLSTLIGSVCFMSDATLEVGAVVQADLTEEEQVFLWHRARRGGLTTRLAPETAWGETLPSPDPVYAPDPLLHAWMPSADASHVCSYRFRGEHHINIQEMLAYRTSVKHAAKIRRLWDCRVPFVQDSTVVCGAATKGRSCSSHLNRVMQGTTPYLLAANIYPLNLWAGSAYNHADDGTRHRRLRAKLDRTPIVDEALRASWQKCTRARLFVSPGAQTSQRYRSLFLDVFSGADSPLTASFRQAGWWALPVDGAIGGPAHDLSDGRVLSGLEQVVRSRATGGVHLATPCSSFSSWMRICPSSTRTTTHPWGRPPITAKEHAGNQCLRASLVLIDAAMAADTPWTLENPSTSLLWQTPEMLALSRRPGVVCITFDWCQYGRPWRKRTKLMGTVAGLDRLSRQCTRDHEHEVLQGNVRTSDGRSVTRTSLAARYSAEFCDEYVALLSRSSEPRGSTADALVKLLVRCRSLTLLVGTQEKDLDMARHSPLAPDLSSTCASEFLTAPSAGTPSAFAL